jgi:hypothetical protein
MKEAANSVKARLDGPGRDKIRGWQKSESWSGWMARGRADRMETENCYVID